MFVQVIESRTNDPDALRGQLQRWEHELMPGAVGYLGSTGGCTASGDLVLMARFEDADSARRNSDRAEQGEWWKETEAYLDGPARFRETTDVDVTRNGDLDDAGFVQVMIGHVADQARLRDLAREAEPFLTELRPELLGSVLAFFDDGEYVEFAYFTNESDARAGEAKELPAEVAEQIAEWDAVAKVEHYRDLAEPWLTTP